MAGWRERFTGTRASFRGVEFVLEEIDLVFGRELTRFDISKAPETSGLAKLAGETLQSDSLYKDEFKLPQEFEVLCAFYGDDYIDKRDAFMVEISKGGSGTLILPNHAPIEVLAGRAVNRFNGQSGGNEKIRVTFAQFEDKEQPTEVIDSLKAAQAGFLSGNIAVEQSFLTKLASGARDAARKMTSLTNKATQTVLDTLGVGAISSTLESVTDLATSITQNVTTLIYAPGDLAGELLDMLEALTFAFTQPKNAFNAQKDVFTRYAQALPSYLPLTPTEQQIEDNQVQMTQIMQNAALIQMGSAITLSVFDSSTEARTYLADFEEQARQQQLINGDTDGFDDVYNAIANIIALVRNHVQSQQTLPAVIEITTEISVPSLVQAEDYYGSATRSEDVILRNNIRNPLFPPKTLEALSF